MHLFDYELRTSTNVFVEGLKKKKKKRRRSMEQIDRFLLKKDNKALLKIAR